MVTYRIANITQAATRLDSKTEIQENGCWIFTGSRDGGGYGQFWCEGFVHRAHRASWEITKGPIPDGMKVLHKCDNPACTNPNHLFLGTQEDNNHDMFAKGRNTPSRGMSNGRAALSDEDVREILHLLSEGHLTQKEIGLKYMVAQTTISYIKRIGWKHLKENA